MILAFSNIPQEEDILFKDVKRSYLVIDSYDTYLMMVQLGALSDDNKTLLQIQQGSATKGICSFNDA